MSFVVSGMRAPQTRTHGRCPGCGKKGPFTWYRGVGGRAYHLMADSPPVQLPIGVGGVPDYAHPHLCKRSTKNHAAGVRTRSIRQRRDLLGYGETAAP